MATHSSILGWGILWTEDPGGLLSIGSNRVRHDCSHFACMHWRILWTEEPGGLLSIGSHRVGHD